MFKKLIISLAILSSMGHAAESREIEIKIINHHFVPNVIKIESGVNSKLIVHNEDKTIEEFESHDLKREKIIPPGKKVVIALKPMKPGTYAFFGEFNQKTAQGKIIVE